ncbi:hypothetical protein [Paraburkholderia susongensis]|uniref:hypothetical protein n=1 Tax=Paraburkholderia susongensis TaxID=1515439 RepID=UPI00142D8EAA|nr:hypothetical protein [Paraburkholderia susongensis]
MLIVSVAAIVMANDMAGFMGLLPVIDAALHGARVEFIGGAGCQNAWYLKRRAIRTGLIHKYSQFLWRPSGSI